MVMRELFRDRLEWLEEAERLVESLDFTLENLGYCFPRYHDGERFLNREEEDVPRKKFVVGHRLRTERQKLIKRIAHVIELNSRHGRGPPSAQAGKGADLRQRNSGFGDDYFYSRPRFKN